MHIVMILTFDNNLIELTANFQKAFGKHNVSVLIGYNYEDNTNSNLSMSNYEFSYRCLFLQQNGSRYGLETW